NHWDQFLYCSQLASSLGIWPWSDVFMSTETANLLLSTLSAGVVGVGDAIGTESAANLYQSILPNAVLVKPDAAIVPLDSTYIAEAQAPPTALPPMEACSGVARPGLSSACVFCYQRSSGSGAISFTPEEAGVFSKAFVYNYFAQTGTVVGANQQFTDNVTSSGSYYIVAPIGSSGIAFCGDAGKFVGLSKQRVSSLSDSGGVLHTVLYFAPNETSVTLFGFAPSQPVAATSDGSLGSMRFNGSTGIFSFTASPGADGNAAITLHL
ncbi:MAG TPA: hypothetical protein VGS41_02380, partial [Chthonomonadales bacterium]|nr:hypothetical protein [Chthonomonadales bacterium]